MSASRLRWAVALGVTALAAGVVIAALVLLGARPTPEALRYVPGDAVVVAEVRMDLPGDQLQKLGNLLAHFPGFKDQSTLLDKLDESFSRVVGEGSGGSLDYRADVKPWLSGPAFIVLRTAPAGGTEPSPTGIGLISATTTGTVTCETPFRGQAVTHESYRALDLTIGPRGEAACALDGRQALLGDPRSVREALDAKAAGTGMDRSDRYQTARAAIGGDQLATLYLDGSRVADAFPLPSGAATTRLAELAALRGRVPEWTMVGVRAEDDALVTDVVAGPPVASTAPSVPPGAATALPRSLPPTHPSVLAGTLPDDAILAIESQGTGVLLQNALDQAGRVPELAPALGALDLIGGAEGLVGWVEDAGVVAFRDAPGPSVGVVLVAHDAQTAADRVATFNGLLALAGLRVGSNGVGVHQSQIAGVTVTTYEITDVGALLPPGALPGGAPAPSIGPVSLSIAARERFVVIGSGEAFLTHLFGAQAGHRLTDLPAYTRALQRALPNSRTSAWVGAPAAISLARQLVPPGVLAGLPADTFQYLEPFEAVLMTSSEDAGRQRLRVVVTVNPD